MTSAHKNSDRLKRYLADIPLLRFPCHLRRHEVFAGAAALFFMQP
jgi:hypothetical protein